MRNLLRRFRRWVGKAEVAQAVAETVRERGAHAETREKLRLAQISQGNAVKKIGELQALLDEANGRAGHFADLAVKASQQVADWLAQQANGKQIYGTAPVVPMAAKPESTTAFRFPSARRQRGSIDEFLERAKQEIEKDLESQKQSVG